LLNAQDVSFLTTAAPSSKYVIGGDLTAGRFDFSLHEIIWGATTTVDQFASGPNAFSNSIFYSQHNSVKAQTNLEVGYEVTDQLRLAFGGTNIFDARPTLATQNTSTGGVVKYDYYSQQIGINGAYYYTALKLSL
jgi:iron complex outermembrane receptor protein